MLVLRLQRTGRTGYALYRLVAQDSRRTPTSGKVAAYLGSYNPHSKATTFDKEKISFYLEHGAQPSARVAVLLKKEGVKLPSWFQAPAQKKRSVRNPDKLRKNRPAEAAPVAAAEPEAAEEPVKDAEAEAVPIATAEQTDTEPTDQPASPGKTAKQDEPDAKFNTETESVVEAEAPADKPSDEAAA